MNIFYHVSRLPEFDATRLSFLGSTSNPLPHHPLPGKRLPTSIPQSPRPQHQLLLDHPVQPSSSILATPLPRPITSHQPLINLLQPLHPPLHLLLRVVVFRRDKTTDRDMRTRHHIAARDLNPGSLRQSKQRAPEVVVRELPVFCGHEGEGQRRGVEGQERLDQAAWMGGRVRN